MLLLFQMFYRRGNKPGELGDLLKVTQLQGCLARIPGQVYPLQNPCFYNHHKSYRQEGEVPAVPVLILWSIASKAAKGDGDEVRRQGTRKTGALEEKPWPHGRRGVLTERWEWTQSAPKGGLCLSFFWRGGLPGPEPSRALLHPSPSPPPYLWVLL